MRFVESEEHHGVVHYLATIIIRLIKFLIFGPLGVYTTAFGFIFFSFVLKTYLPADFYNPIENFFYRLPYFLQIKDFTLNGLDCWYSNVKGFWAVIVGFPLIIMGINIFIISISTLILVIVNPSYNRSRCPICKNPMQIKNGKVWES
jgi:hypothetical protein